MSDKLDQTEEKQESVAEQRISSLRLKLIVGALTLAGIALFSYFVYSVGINEIIANVERFGFVGFVGILAIFFVRICLRAWAWSLSVYQPYYLKLRDTIPAVIIGEAMSSLMPLGILVSGTAKAVAVRRRVPLVVGLSSVATENLFYSFTTSIFLIAGSITFIRLFELDPFWVLTIDVLIGLIIAILIFLVLMVVRQWHIASETLEWIYQKGYLTGILEHGRLQARLFENFIYGYYRQHPKRFLPICLIEAVYHFLGVLEVYFILTRILESGAYMVNAFLLESVSRLLSIMFKLVPFLVGVDEAGAQFVAETVGIGAGIGITLAIIRKGRVLFWSGMGLLLIAKRGIGLRHFYESVAESKEQAEKLKAIQ